MASRSSDSPDLSPAREPLAARAGLPVVESSLGTRSARRTRHVHDPSRGSASAQERAHGLASKGAESPPPHGAPKPRAYDDRRPDYARETALLRDGLKFVAGIDEAGRGPLAGPVVAAAVVLDVTRLPPGLDDSKKLTAATRERLFAAILASADVGIASASASEIDRFNIRGATLIAMRRALEALAYPPCHALIDGRDVPPGLGSPATAVVSGDSLCLSIAAASIVAKVTRDAMMRRACARFPRYGFSRHMGYGTAQHLRALGEFGPSPLHRMSFRPLRVGPET